MEKTSNERLSEIIKLLPVKAIDETCLEDCQFIIDYLTACIEVYYNKLELKNTTPLTFEELELLLKKHN